MLWALNQRITYWPPGVDNQFGGKMYGTPQILSARWEDDFENIISAKGQEIVSKAKVYCLTSLIDTGYVYNGVSSATDPTSVDGAWEIRTVTQIPNLSSLERLYTAFI